MRILQPVLLCAGTPSIRISLSEDRGSTWRSRDDWLLHSQAGDDLARAREGNFAAYMQSMGKWTFGWPTAVEIRAGEILTAYYAGEGDRSSIYLRTLFI